jgi:hypothetical protein
MHVTNAYGGSVIPKFGLGRIRKEATLICCKLLSLRLPQETRTTSATVAAPWFCLRFWFSDGADAHRNRNSCNGNHSSLDLLRSAIALGHDQVLTFIRLCEVRSGNYFYRFLTDQGTFVNIYYRRATSYRGWARKLCIFPLQLQSDGYQSRWIAALR